MRFSRRRIGPVLFVLMSVVCSTGLLAGDMKMEGPIESRNEGSMASDGSMKVAAADGRPPIAASGQWTSAGMTLPRMILHNLIFYVNSDTNPPCSFTMNFVLSQSTSRTTRRFDLAVGDSTQVRFEAGIDTRDLRFGTIGGGTCVRHWMALGRPRPDFLFSDSFESPP